MYTPKYFVEREFQKCTFHDLVVETLHYLSSKRSQVDEFILVDGDKRENYFLQFL